MRDKKDKYIEKRKNGRITIIGELPCREKRDLEIILCNNKGKELDRAIFKNGRNL